MPNHDFDESPLAELGELQQSIPALEISGEQIAPYSINWHSQEVKENFNLSGSLPDITVAANTPDFNAKISSRAFPLSLHVTIFSGGIQTVNPESAPAHTYECVSQNCLKQLPDSLELNLDSSAWGDTVVVSIFAEYWRDPAVAADEGPTNLVTWVFEYSQAP